MRSAQRIASVTGTASAALFSPALFPPALFSPAFFSALLFFFILTTGLIAQERYIIYFRDKGIGENMVLNKSMAEYQEAERLLSKESIERRKKVMGGENYIQYDDLPLHAPYLRELESKGIKIINRLRWINAVSAYLTPDEFNMIRKLSFIKNIDPAVRLRYRNQNIDDQSMHQLMKRAPFDSAFYGVSYSQLALSDVPAVHKKGISGHGVRIGLLDTGFKWDVSEAMKHVKVLRTYDFVSGDTITWDESSSEQGMHTHGSSVFSIIAGYLPGKFLGPAYGATYLLAKTEDTRSETHVEEDNYGAALEWMESIGVDITSSSLGYNELDTDSYTYADMNGRTAIVTIYSEKAFQKGIMTITSAGNEGNKSWRYITAPGDGFNILTVGAVDADNVISDFSSRGPTSDGRIKPEVVARGSWVYFANSNYPSSFSAGNGTSYSTPIVSGIAGLLLSAYPHLTNVQMRNIIIATAGNASAPNNERGYGLVSAKRVIEYPNIESMADGYLIHKAFLNASGVKPESVQLFISNDNRNFTPYQMASSGSSVFYSYRFSNMQQGESVYFYFGYNDSLGTNHKYPEKTSMIFTAGNPLVREVKTAGEVSYQLSQNHPNPFGLNTGTNIRFVAEAGEKAELYIIDAIGQKVRVFNIVSIAGDNTVFWNGRNDKNENCASGVYYYILRKGGKEYGNKMVLIK